MRNAPANAVVSAIVRVLICIVLLVSVASSFSPALPVTDLLAHAVLQDGLRSLLGIVGSAKCNFQLLQWSSDSGTGLASSSCEMAVGVRGAWMLLGGYQGKTCRIDVLQQSVFLMALATR